MSVEAAGGEPGRGRPGCVERGQVRVQEPTATSSAFLPGEGGGLEQKRRNSQTAVGGAASQSKQQTGEARPSGAYAEARPWRNSASCPLHPREMRSSHPPGPKTGPREDALAASLGKALGSLVLGPLCEAGRRKARMWGSLTRKPPSETALPSAAPNSVVLSCPRAGCRHQEGAGSRQSRAGQGKAWVSATWASARTPDRGQALETRSHNEGACV